MYRLEFLPSALADILDAEDYLFEFAPDVAEKFSAAIHHCAIMLTEHPFMYQIYDDNPYFRSMPLPYSYRLFYHIDETTASVKIHRVLHGMRNLGRLL